MSLLLPAQDTQPELFPSRKSCCARGRTSPGSGDGCCKKSKASGGISRTLLAFQMVFFLTLRGSWVDKPPHKSQAAVQGSLEHRPRLGLIFNWPSEEAGKNHGTLSFGEEISHRHGSGSCWSPSEALLGASQHSQAGLQGVGKSRDPPALGLPSSGMQILPRCTLGVLNLAWGAFMRQPQGSVMR